MLGAYAYKCPFFTGDNQARDGSTFWVRCEGGSCVRLPSRADAGAYVREYCASTVDAVMAETAMTYGTPVLQDDGSLKGYHLQLGKFDPREVMRQWMVTASRGEDGGMLIGVRRAK